MSRMNRFVLWYGRETNRPFLEIHPVQRALMLIYMSVPFLWIVGFVLVADNSSPVWIGMGALVLTIATVFAQTKLHNAVIRRYCKLEGLYDCEKLMM